MTSRRYVDGVIREASRSDARRMAEITVAAWKTAYVGIVPDRVLQHQTVERHLDYWLTDQAWQPPMRTWIAEVDGHTVGYAHAGAFRPELGEDSNAGELWGMYVDPDFTGRGYGHQLMAAVNAYFWSRGWGTAYLWVLRDNRNARRFYEGEGWNLDSTAHRVDPLPQVRYRLTASADHP